MKFKLHPNSSILFTSYSYSQLLQRWSDPARGAVPIGFLVQGSALLFLRVMFSGFEVQCLMQRESLASKLILSLKVGLLIRRYLLGSHSFSRTYMPLLRRRTFSWAVIPVQPILIRQRFMAQREITFRVCLMREKCGNTLTKICTGSFTTQLQVHCFLVTHQEIFLFFCVF